MQLENKNATGTRVFELPITPERVVAALHKAESTKGQK